MLFLARADGGETARDLRPVMVRDEIDQVVEYYEAALEEAGVRLVVDGNGQVHANSRLLRRPIANLVSNAIKATPHGQTILHRCDPDDKIVATRLRNPGHPI